MSFLINLARQKRIPPTLARARTAGLPLCCSDVVRLYRLVVEQTGLGVTVYQAVQEGVPLRAERWAKHSRYTSCRWMIPPLPSTSAGWRSSPRWICPPPASGRAKR